MIYRLNDEYYVRTIREADLDGPYPSWFEDQDVCRYNSHGKFVRTADYFRRFLQTLDRDDVLVWAICHTTDGHVGNVSLQALSFINRSAEFAIILGDVRHMRRGVGKLAARKILEHGFFKLNLNRVHCGTAATNEGMKRLALDMGMKQEGIRRAQLFLEGAWIDVVEYGILRSEFSCAEPE